MKAFKIGIQKIYFEIIVAYHSQSQRLEVPLATRNVIIYSKLCKRVMAFTVKLFQFGVATGTVYVR